MTRLLVLALALVFIAGLAFLTVTSIIEEGLTAEGVVSILVLVLLAVGVIGAAITPPREPPS